jgi:indolepyruvate ferredoxin oxidoreductase beta subunit
MKIDIVLAGVGGQGVLSIAAIIAAASRDDGLQVKQGEVHGMAQRGGAVQANLRIADHEIHSDLIAKGDADLVLSMEPLESLRYIDYLAPEGVLVTSTDPVKNIDNYPGIESVLDDVRKVPRAHLVATGTLAKKAGSPLASNVVLVGAVSHLLPVSPDTLRTNIQKMFQRKGERIIEANLKAFEAGRDAVACTGA